MRACVSEGEGGLLRWVGARHRRVGRNRLILCFGRLSARMLASERDLCAHVRTTTVVRKRRAVRAELFVTLRCTRASRIGTDMIPLAGRRVPCASARYCFRTERTRNCSLIESYPAYASAAPRAAVAMQPPGHTPLRVRPTTTRPEVCMSSRWIKP